MRPPVLFVNHGQQRCGVQEFGVEIAEQIASSTRFDIIYTECNSLEEYAKRLYEHEPVAAILNFHQATMPWARVATLARSDIAVVGIIHDVTNAMADSWDGPLFDIMITHDPDLKTSNPRFRPGPRPLPRHRATPAPLPPGPIRIGSFGFAGYDKGFDEIVRLAQEAFDECVISLHIPAGDFVDPAGTAARDIVAKCQAMVRKPGVSVEGSHGFLSREGLIDMLAGHHMNAFLYHRDRGDGGISSSADIALCAGRPIALRRGQMFRHFERVGPSVFVDDLSFRQILENGAEPLAPFLKAWSPEALVAAHERALTDALAMPRRDRVLHAARGVTHLLAEFRHTVASPAFWASGSVAFPKVYAPSSPSIGSLTGHVSGDQFVFDRAEEGFALFGPYALLPGGHFTARVRFAPDHPMVGQATFDACAKVGTEVLAHRVVDSSDSISPLETIELPFSLETSRTDVEIRLVNKKGFSGRIVSMEIDREQQPA